MRAHVTGWCIVLAMGLWAGALQPAQEVNQLLDLVPYVQTKEAWECLRKATRLLENSKDFTRAERVELTARLAKAIIERNPTPDEIIRLLGPKARKQVARQMYYRRYLEHWLFES